MSLSRIAKKLQSIPENKLTTTIIIPLLEKMGYLKVEFNGGPNEQGKDIILWEKNRFDSIEVTVAQVKHFKFNNTAASSRSFQGVVNQLQNCISTPLRFIDQKTYFPQKTLLISSYEIDTATLQTRFKEQAPLQGGNIEIIDGLRLAELIVAKAPELLKDVLNEEYYDLGGIAVGHSNDVLLRALGYTEPKAMDKLYTDIDFSLGKMTTELFFNADFSPILRQLDFETRDWEDFKKSCLLLEEEYGQDFFHPSFEEVERLVLPKLQKHEQWQQQLSGLSEKIIERKKKAEISRSQYLRYERKLKLVDEDIKQLELLGKAVEEEKVVLQGDLKSSLGQARYEMDNDEDSLRFTEDEISRHRALEEPPYHTIYLDGTKLSAQILQKREWIEKKVKQYNRKEPAIADIRSFILRCKGMIDSASIIFSSPVIYASLSEKSVKKNRVNFESTRFKLPVDRIFDAGINVAVLGEAGAGKTTCLDMYASAQLGRGLRQVIPLPLSRVVQAWLQKKEELPISGHFTVLEQAAVHYLTTIGHTISVEGLESMLEEQKVTMILDGIDEAVKSADWLMSDINAIAKKYTQNLQLIVSCRMSAEYMNEINFFAITLLPFTAAQRNSFIEKWFAGGNVKTAKVVVSHLEKHKAVGEIIKTPLLATTLCVLAESGLPLPNSELKLYEDRLKLLTGYYDNVKRVERTTSTPNNLELIAQRVAFNLHKLGLREMLPDQLKALAVSGTVGRMSVSQAETGFEELIDPCNILIPMDSEGKYGLGHLLYQEHLVARELLQNRSVDLLPLMKNPWWMRAMTLFSQMNDDIEWLIREVGKRGAYFGVRETLSAMLMVRPKAQREKDNGLLNKYITLNRLLPFDDPENEAWLDDPESSNYD